MSKARVMVIGAVGAGKTSLIKVLNSKSNMITKTQSIEYTANTIDTPGEFSENPFYFRALFATSLESDMLLLLQDATKRNGVFPPGFAKAFPKPAIGIISKIDHPEANIQLAQSILSELGFTENIYPVSSFTGEGIEDLKKALKW